MIVDVLTRHKYPLLGPSVSYKDLHDKQAILLSRDNSPLEKVWLADYISDKENQRPPGNSKFIIGDR